MALPSVGGERGVRVGWIRSAVAFVGVVSYWFWFLSIVGIGRLEIIASVGLHWSISTANSLWRACFRLLFSWSGGVLDLWRPYCGRGIRTFSSDLSETVLLENRVNPEAYVIWSVRGCISSCWPGSDGPWRRWGIANDAAPGANPGRAEVWEGEWNGNRFLLVWNGWTTRHQAEANISSTSRDSGALWTRSLGICTGEILGPPRFPETSTETWWLCQ